MHYHNAFAASCGVKLKCADSDRKTTEGFCGWYQSALYKSANEKVDDEDGLMDRYNTYQNSKKNEMH